MGDEVENFSKFCLGAFGDLRHPFLLFCWLSTSIVDHLREEIDQPTRKKSLGQVPGPHFQAMFHQLEIINFSDIERCS